MILAFKFHKCFGEQFNIQKFFSIAIIIKLYPKCAIIKIKLVAHKAIYCIGLKPVFAKNFGNFNHALHKR